jgi:hypothetical protein
MTEEQKIRDMLERFKAEHVGVDPQWKPLEDLLPMNWCDGFMFMQGGLGPNHDINAYKHGITRKYLHIDAAGQCYRWTGDGYEPRDSVSAILHVYEGIEQLGGATPETPYDAEYRARRDAALQQAGFTVIS